LSKLFEHFTVAGGDVVGMVIFAAVLVFLCLWAQGFRKKHRDIIGNSKYFLYFSAALTIVCIFALGTKWLKLGLDFTGGTILELGFRKGVSQELIRTTITGLSPDILEPQVQLEESAAAGADKEYIKAFIRLGKKNNEQLTTAEADGIIAKLRTATGDLKEYKRESVGPIVGRELLTNGLLAILLALFLQLIYITFRFGNQVRYGIAADLAMAHDVIIMMGIYSLFERQADSPFLAALLTVIGYSVMDSIIIFDRIRENLKLIKKANFEEVVNISVNQTMTRSIYTLMTCLITLFALYYFGGGTLKNFAFSLLVGLTSGAYSSIFVASPLLVWFDKRARQQEEARVTARRATLQAQAEAKAAEKAQVKKAATATPLDESFPDISDLPDASGVAGRSAPVRTRSRAARARKVGGRKRK
jgi:preprotein translocase subunit SecF